MSAVIGESDSSQSVADSISTTSGQLSVSEATASDTLAAMAASVAQSGQGSLWATEDLAARQLPSLPPLPVPALVSTAEVQALARTAGAECMLSVRPVA